MENRFLKYPLFILIRMQNCHSYMFSLSDNELSLFCDALCEKYDDYLLGLYLDGE